MLTHISLSQFNPSVHQLFTVVILKLSRESRNICKMLIENFRKEFTRKTTSISGCILNICVSGELDESN